MSKREGYRQGDVFVMVGQIPFEAKKLDHVVLAEGEVTGHCHKVTEGEAELYEWNNTLYLRVKSPTAVLSHQEHGPVTIPRGDFEIGIQQEYTPEGWNRVKD